MWAGSGHVRRHGRDVAVAIGFLNPQHPVLREVQGARGHSSQPRDPGWVGATRPDQQPNLQLPIGFAV